MRIQKITKADGQLVYDFALACSDYFTDWGKETPTMAAVLTDFFDERPPETKPEQKEVYAILENEKMIGIIDLLHDYPKAETTILGLMVLRPEYRKQGLGERYFHQIQDYCQRLGQRKLRLGVLQDNTAGQHIWQKMGFQKVSETTDPYGPMDVMEKALT